MAAVQALDLRRLRVLVPLLLARQHAARAGLELDRGIADAVDLLARHVAAVPPLHRQRRLGRLRVRLRVALLQLLLRLDLELRHRGGRVSAPAAAPVPAAACSRCDYSIASGSGSVIVVINGKTCCESRSTTLRLL